jgi:hypothetical protein
MDIKIGGINAMILQEGSRTGLRRAVSIFWI